MHAVDVGLHTSSLRTASRIGAAMRLVMQLVGLPAVLIYQNKSKVLIIKFLSGSLNSVQAEDCSRSQC